jgi:hypothetical protein
VPTRREDIQGIDAEFLIREGRPWDVVAAGKALPGLAKLLGYGFTVEVAAARQADLLGQERTMAAVLARPALRACITPGEGEVPRELLLATIALAASGAVAGVPVNWLRDGSIVDLNLRSCGLGPMGAQLIALLIPVKASVTSVNVLSNQLDVDSADLLLKVKAEKPNLRTLCGLTHEETELNLWNRSLGPGDAKLLAAEILVMASVTKILVSSNRLGDKGTTILCDALRESKVTNVQELDLSDNNIGRDGAKAIAALCAAMASLTSVR